MEDIKLDVQIRKEVGSREVKKIRQQDLVPGIIYGGKGEPTSVKVDRRTYERIRRAHQGESIVCHLNMFDGDKELKGCSVIVLEEQHDPVSDKILHVDFKKISLKEKLQVKVPIVVKGESAGVKKGGALDHHLWELEIECLPAKIPQNVEVNVESLDIGDNICVKDVVLPKDVECLTDPEIIVISVTPPMKEEEAAEESGGEVEPEVIKKKSDKESDS